MTALHDDQLGVWGRDDMMAIAAVRYCLGRMTYIVSDCADWLVAHWTEFGESTRKCIQRDIDEAFVRDDECRGRLDNYKPLGMDMDRAQWERVRKLWAPNARLTAPATRTRSQKLADAGFTRRPSLRASDMRAVLELIAAPMRPDGTWNRDREACRELAAEALGRYDESKPPNCLVNGQADVT